MMKPQNKPYCLVMPACLYILSIIGVGLYTSLKQSMGIIPTLGLGESTFKYYSHILMDQEIMKSMVFSLYVALVSSIVATVLGIALAYCLYTAAHQSQYHKILYRLPIIIPYTVMALMVFNLLSKSGFISRVSYALGLIEKMEDFPLLIFDRSGIGIIIGYVLKQMPFVGMMTYGVLSSINKDMVLAAKNLGATPRRVFLNILLPLSLPTILTAWFIIFTFSFGAFEIPFLLGATQPKVISVYAYIAYTSADLSQRPRAMAINTMILVVTILLSGIYFYLISRMKTYKGGGWR